MQTPTRMNKVVIENLSYDDSGWKRELDGTNTSIVNLFFKPWGPFALHLPLLQHY